MTNADHDWVPLVRSQRIKREQQEKRRVIFLNIMEALAFIALGMAIQYAITHWKL
jgi:hypothetical protein